MERLGFEEVKEKFIRGEITAKEISEGLKDRSIHLYHEEIDELIVKYLKTDEDRRFLIEHAYFPVAVIRALLEGSDREHLQTDERITEESAFEIMKGIRSQKDKGKIATKYLTKEYLKIKAIDELEREEDKLLVKLTLGREGYLQYFLNDERKYKEIGLDENITFGVEIETMRCTNDKNNTDFLLEQERLARRRRR